MLRSYSCDESAVALLTLHVSDCFLFQELLIDGASEQCLKSKGIAACYTARALVTRNDAFINRVHETKHQRLISRQPLVSEVVRQAPVMARAVVGGKSFATWVGVCRHVSDGLAIAWAHHV